MQVNKSKVWPQLGAMAHELPCRVDEVEHLFALLHSIELQAVQLGVPFLEEIMAREALLATWQAQLKASSIQLSALGGYRNLITPDKARRATNIAFLQRCLELAPSLGTTIVATETGTYSRASDWAASPANQGQEAWEALYASLNELLPVAERYSVILALEGHVNHVINTPERLARLLEQFPTPNLQVVLDPYNYLGKEQLPYKELIVASFLQQFKDRFALVHLKDVHQQGAEVDTPAFGHGVFPQNIYLDFLQLQRPDLPLIIEHATVEQFPAILHSLRTWHERTA
ncbi:sugar phosphate isomerase/epimerase [Ktedonosporobacter rubrisoli]|uniref:Sugar phosphate isomerase/epimerase n=1 Tax=Ktedonosporobacter rubrisoli TaxID=2509675 RepID=A0A4P6JVR4_KTERU|nr:sugar phosphate isomerase/epimerase family protein [Ktedonosporobacter rubrisoli]QBD79473.1 sugar phosphate isomerase/epimerase [Ktedonosporobacter rubrisoli]